MRSISFLNPLLRKSVLHSRGFTLVELMISIGISTIAAVLFSAGYLSIMKSSFFTQETMTRKELTRLIKNALSDRRSLLMTAFKNPNLNSVIQNDFAATGPLACNQFYALAIYDSSGLMLSGPSLPSPGSPVLYMLDGTACPAGMNFGDGNCVVAVTSSFMFQGVPNAGSMDRLVSVSSLPIPGHGSPSYPGNPPGLKAEFILVNFKIDFFPKPGMIDRKASQISVIINLQDLGF